MASTSKKIMLTSSDGETFEVEEAVAVESQTIKHMIEVDCADSAIPIPNVTSKILSKVLEYCKKHVDAATAASNSDDELNAWDAGFVEVNREALFELIKVKVKSTRRWMRMEECTQIVQRLLIPSMNVVYIASKRLRMAKVERERIKRY